MKSFKRASAAVTRPAYAIHTRSLFGQPGLMLDASRIENTDELIPLTRRGFYEVLAEDAAFRSLLIDTLLGTGFAALAWETTPISRATADLPMAQCVLPHPALARALPDIASFGEHLNSGRGTTEVRTFLNWGGDARLIVPCEPKAKIDYAHLIAFLKNAPPAQRDTLFRDVGVHVLRHLETSDEPVWVSTAGMGVSWLHVRLDKRPKYYRTDSFRALK